MFRLDGQCALVTGATGGIGWEIAKALHAQGATVTISGTRKEKLDELAKELKDRCHVIPCNLGDADSIESLIDHATSTMGRIDILVNNAGLTRDTLMMRMKDEDWETVLSVNLGAAFRLSRGCLRGMMKNRHGRIISISSVVGVTGNPGQANYVAAKAGMIGMSKALAAEVASRGITVNCVAPGFIATPMTDVLTDDQKARINSTIPMAKMGSPADIAAAVVFLASQEAQYVTGQTVHVNGGMAMI